MARYWTGDRRNPNNKPFVGVDGEGANIQDPDALPLLDADGDPVNIRHKYVLLRAGSEYISNPLGLDFYDIAEFLCGLDKHAIYVSYAFDYDVTKIIESLDPERWRRLYNRKLRSVPNPNGRGVRQLPLNIDSSRGHYEIDYLESKYFKIRRQGERRWLEINDVWTFFQSPFIKALEQWNIGTPEMRDRIRIGKAMRSEFSQLDSHMMDYNHLEILLLQALMTEFRPVVRDLYYIPRQWQGPGCIAEAMFKRHNVPTRDAFKYLYEDDEFRKLCNDAYFGGRFETTSVGPIRGPLYQYDIRSAYPHQIRQLPCVFCGTWRRVSERPSRGQLWVGRVSFTHDSQPTPGLLYNLPMRFKNGEVVWPYEGIGFYWSTEIEAAEEAGTIVRFMGGYAYEPNCEHRYFDWVEADYIKRRELGSQRKGLALKLALNSLYGKMCQSVGQAPYANPVWGGLITAGARAQIIRAYKENRSDIYMIQTDAVYSGVELPKLEVGDELGQWEKEVLEDGIFLIQAGIYYHGDTQAKTRGIVRGRINKSRPDFEAIWLKYYASHGENYTLPVQVDHFYTAKQAIQLRNPRLAGQWAKLDREVGFRWGEKRSHDIALDKRSAVRSYPAWGNPLLISAPYTRLIGGDFQPDGPDFERYISVGLQEKARMETQPDWTEPMLADPNGE